MKNWRDWLRERWPFWRPFPRPLQPENRKLVLVLSVSDSFLKDAPELARALLKREAERQIDLATA